MSELIIYAKNQLPSQFYEKENWNKYIERVIIVPNEINNKTNNLILFDLDNCTGIGLDIIGDIIGIKRQSKIDDDYRKELKLYSKLNNAHGNPDNFIFAFNSLINPNQMFYNEGTDDEIVLYVNFKEIPNNEVLEIIKKCIPAGMKLKIYFTENIEIFKSSMRTYKLFANGEQIITNNNDKLYASFGADPNKKRFTQSLFGNNGQLFANGEPIAIDLFEDMSL